MKTKLFFFVLSVCAMLLSSCSTKPTLNYYTFDADGLLKLDVTKPVGNALVDLNGDSIGTLVGRETKAGDMLCYNGTDEMLVMIHLPYTTSSYVPVEWSLEHDIIFIHPHKFFHLTRLPDYTDNIPEQIRSNREKQTVRILVPSKELLRKIAGEYNRELPVVLDEGMRLQRIHQEEGNLVHDIMLYELSAEDMTPEFIESFAAELCPDMLSFTREWLQTDASALIRDLNCPIDYNFVDKNSNHLFMLHFVPAELK